MPKENEQLVKEAAQQAQVNAETTEEAPVLLEALHIHTEASTSAEQPQVNIEAPATEPASSEQPQVDAEAPATELVLSKQSQIGVETNEEAPVVMLNPKVKTTLVEHAPVEILEEGSKSELDETFAELPKVLPVSSTPATVDTHSIPNDNSAGAETTFDTSVLESSKTQPGKISHLWEQVRKIFLVLPPFMISVCTSILIIWFIPSVLSLFTSLIEWLFSHFKYSGEPIPDFTNRVEYITNIAFFFIGVIGYFTIGSLIGIVSTHIFAHFRYKNVQKSAIISAIIAFLSWYIVYYYRLSYMLIDNSLPIIIYVFTLSLSAVYSSLFMSISDWKKAFLPEEKAHKSQSQDKNKVPSKPRLGCFKSLSYSIAAIIAFNSVVAVITSIYQTIASTFSYSYTEKLRTAQLIDNFTYLTKNNDFEGACRLFSESISRQKCIQKVSNTRSDSSQAYIDYSGLKAFDTNFLENNTKAQLEGFPVYPGPPTGTVYASLVKENNDWRLENIYMCESYIDTGDVNTNSVCIDIQQF